MINPDIMFPILIIGMFIFVFAGSAAQLYNRMVEQRQSANQAFADMDVQLKKRRDLVPNLVETVRSYAAHESEALTTLTRLRASAIGTTSPDERVAAENALGAGLGKLFAVAEAYPDLKANQNFLRLQDQLEEVEADLATSRQMYNAAVAAFNASTERFPTVFFARAFGFKPKDFFDLGTEVRSALDAPPPVRI